MLCINDFTFSTRTRIQAMDWSHAQLMEWNNRERDDRIVFLEDLQLGLLYHFRAGSKARSLLVWSFLPYSKLNMFYLGVEDPCWSGLSRSFCSKTGSRIHDNNNPIVELPFSGELIDRIDYFIDLWRKGVCVVNISVDMAFKSRLR
jgi:hypothetical protein